jgi:hypothetical protein
MSSANRYANRFEKSGLTPPKRINAKGGKNLAQKTQDTLKKKVEEYKALEKKLRKQVAKLRVSLKVFKEQLLSRSQQDSSPARRAQDKEIAPAQRACKLSVKRGKGLDKSRAQPRDTKQKYRLVAGQSLEHATQGAVTEEDMENIRRFMGTVEPRVLLAPERDQFIVASNSVLGVSQNNSVYVRTGEDSVMVVTRERLAASRIVKIVYRLRQQLSAGDRVRGFMVPASKR